MAVSFVRCWGIDDVAFSLGTQPVYKAQRCLMVSTSPISAHPATCFTPEESEASMTKSSELVFLREMSELTFRARFGSGRFSRFMNFLRRLA